MSLRIVGDQLLQTASGHPLDGATLASASFWIQVNPGNNVGGTAGVEIFGDTAGVFSATLLGADLLQLQWTSVASKAPATSTCTVGLVAGTAYHVATTWQAGSQVYYLNGVPIRSDDQGQTLGLATGTRSRPFRLGSDQSGTDVTLSRPALWVGYALKPADVLALRDGKAQPGSIAPGSIAMEWSLDGVAGVAAAVGDPGLADGSANALTLGTIVGSAPVYQAGDLAYTPAPAYGPATASPSGESIILILQDAEGNPSNVKAVQGSSPAQTVQLFGHPRNNQFTLSFNGEAITPLATTTVDPPVYFQWTPPTTSGHSYALAAYYWTDFSGGGSLAYYFETIDTGSVVATRLVTSTPVADAFTDANSSSTFGPATWIPITPAGGVTASGPSLAVRWTAGNSLIYPVGALRVEDLTAGTVAYYTLQMDGSGNPIPTSTYTYQPPSGYWRADSNPVFYGGVRYQSYGNPFYGPTTTINPSGPTTGAELLQAALEAMPGIGEGNVTVTDETGSGTGNYLIVGRGALKAATLAAFTSSDPSIVVTVDAAGGQGFTLNRSGTSMLLGDIVYGESGDCPFIQLPLPQSWPEVKTWPNRTLPCVLAGGYGNRGYWDGPDYSLSSSVSKDVLFGWSSGLTASFPILRIPVGTYQIAVTWPHAPFAINGTNYAPSTATQFLLLDDAGNTLETFTVDQTKAPTDYVDAEGIGWHVLYNLDVTARDTDVTLVMNTVGQSAATSGATQVVAILDAVQFTRTSADASITVEPGDTLSVPAGFVTCAAGPVPALVDAPIAGPTAILPAFEAGPKSMILGYNIGIVGYPDDFPYFSNLYALNSIVSEAQTSDGWPTRIRSPYQVNYDILVERNPFQASVAQPYQGVTFTPPGRYLMTYDGDPIFSLASHGPGTTLTLLDVPRPAGAPANWLVYDVAVDPNLSNRPELVIKTMPTTVDPTDPSGETYIVNLTNLHIYPPDPADPTGKTVWGLSADGSSWSVPPKFWPHFIDKLSGVNCVRVSGALNTNEQAVSTFDFFKPDTQYSRSNPTYSSWLPDGTPGWPIDVVSIRAATPQECPQMPGLGPVVMVETTGNANFFDGATFGFYNCGVGQFTGGTYAMNSTDTYHIGLVIGIPDSTHLLCVITAFPNLGTMTNVLTPAAGKLMGQNFGSLWSLSDVTDLVRSVGPSCTRLHLNVTATIDATPGGAADKMAAFMAANLPAWVTEVGLEFSNEIWNIIFPQSYWAVAKGVLNYGVPANSSAYNGTAQAPFHAHAGKLVHDRFVAAFNAAGRPGVVKRMFGSQAGQAGVQVALLDALKAIATAESVPLSGLIDEVCVASYVNACAAFSGEDADQMPIFNRMTTGQILDYNELLAVHGSYPAQFAGTATSVFSTYGLADARVVFYEGSMSGMIPVDPPSSLPNPPGNTPDFANRMFAAVRHPRVYAITLAYCQAFQDAGTHAWCYNYIGGTTSDNWWAAFSSDTQPFGTGDPVTDAIGITNPLDPNRAPCQIAGAVRSWANMVTTAAPVPSNNPRMYPPYRNGWVGTRGLVRGLARPTRFR